MIEVIKHGQKKFKTICTNCGCEFTYELSDMKPLGGVDCPDCGEYVVHQIFENNNGNLYYPPNCRGVEKMTKERNEIKDIMKLLDKCVSLNPMCKSEVASVLYGNNYRKAEEVRKETAKEILDKLNALMEQYHYKSTAWRNCTNFIKETYGVEVEK